MRPQVADEFAAAILNRLALVCHSEAHYRLIFEGDDYWLNARKRDGLVRWGVDQAAARLLQEGLEEALQRNSLSVVARSHTAWKNEDGSTMTEVRGFVFCMHEAGILNCRQVSASDLKEAIATHDEPLTEPNYAEVFLGP